MNESVTQSLTLQELPELRRKTEAVSKFLQDHLTTHLDTLKALLSPERVFGKLAGGKLEVAGADRALAELTQAYRPFASKPYDLPSTFDANWLTLVGHTLEVHPWEYVIRVADRPITMSSPVKWVLNYRTNYTLAQVQAVLAGSEPLRLEFLRQFVVNALVLQGVLARQPAVVQLLRDLRYASAFESLPALPKLPVATISASLPSFRPADELIQMATAFSGVPAFIELIDPAATRDWHDPLKQRIEELLK